MGVSWTARNSIKPVGWGFDVPSLHHRDASGREFQSGPRKVGRWTRSQTVKFIQESRRFRAGTGVTWTDSGGEEARLVTSARPDFGGARDAGREETRNLKIAEIQQALLKNCLFLGTLYTSPCCQMPILGEMVTLTLDPGNSSGLLGDGDELDLNVLGACLGMQVEENFKVELERSDAGRSHIHRVYEDFLGCLYENPWRWRMGLAIFYIFALRVLRSHASVCLDLSIHPQSVVRASSA